MESEFSRSGYVSKAVDRYLEWLSIPFYVVLYGFNEDSQRYEFRYFRSAKRGDSRYASRVTRRFDDVASRVPSREFFKFGHHGIIHSSCLLVTLTFGRSIDLVVAWVSLGPFLNGYLSYLRRRYGKIAVLRCWESHVDGYPHIHVLILFKDWSFKGFSYRSKKKATYGKLMYAVDSKDSIARGWSYGHVKVLAVSSVHSGFSYVGKYLRKSVRVSEGDSGSAVVKTLALCWDFHKRAYSLSGDWSLAPSDLIVPLKSNSNSGVPFWALLDGSRRYCGVVSWKLYGFYKGDSVFLSSDSGVLDVSMVNDLGYSGLLHRPFDVDDWRHSSFERER